MKKLLILILCLVSLCFADKILTGNLGGKCFPSSKVEGGYTDCHAINVKWNLTKGRITTEGSLSDSNETFFLQLRDFNDQRLDFIVEDLKVNWGVADDNYKVSKNEINDVKRIEIRTYSDENWPYQEEYKCYDDSKYPLEFRNNNGLEKVKCVEDIKKQKCNSIFINEEYTHFVCYPSNTKHFKFIDLYNKEFVCQNGYALNYDTTCVKPFICGKNEYAVDSLNCEILPENSHRNKTIGFTCNKNFVLNRNNECEEKKICQNDEIYKETENACYEHPINAHWSDKESIEWECDSNYIEQNGYCEVKSVCNENQKYVETDNLCVNPPANGSWDYRGNVVCNEGYVKIGLLCEQKADCEHWNSENNTCFEKPAHSHWVYSEGATWECDDGYHSDMENEYCFKCEGETQFNYSTNTCVTKPENSHWSSEGIWHCNDGFFETEYNCEEIKECGFFERYNSYTNECVDKPSDSHWTSDNSTNWECDDGYYKTYSDKCEKINHIDLTNYISFAHDLTFGIGAGSGKDQKDNSTTIFNVEANYNIGVKIGNEFFNVRPQFSAGLLYTEFEYSGYIYMDETVNSMAFTFGPNIGFDFWKFSFDYSYLWRSGERLESITFNDAYSKYKFGFNINEHFNVNVSMISNMISSTQRLKEFDDNIFSLGLTYRF